MYIQSIHIEDLKCFQGVHEIDLTRPDGTYAGWTVVAGRNGSGKTTLLKAMAVVVGAQHSDFHRRMNLLPPPANDAHAEFTVVSEPRDSGSWRHNSTASYTWKNKYLAIGGYGDRPPSLKENNRFRNSSIFRSHGWFLAAWGAHRYLGPYNPSDDYLTKDDDLAPISHLFMKSPTLVNALDWLKELRFRELEEDAGAGALLKRVLALVNDGLLPDGVTIHKVSFNGVFARREGEEELAATRNCIGLCNSSLSCIRSGEASTS